MLLDRPILPPSYFNSPFTLMHTTNISEQYQKFLEINCLDYLSFIINFSSIVLLQQEYFFSLIVGNGGAMVVFSLNLFPCPAFHNHHFFFVCE